jgi:hypothetical protein
LPKGKNSELNKKKMLSSCRRIRDSVAKGPKFRPQSSKWADQNLVGPGKSGAELFPDLSNKGRKGAELFLGLVFHIIIYISCQN